MQPAYRRNGVVEAIEQQKYRSEPISPRASEYWNAKQRCCGPSMDFGRLELPLGIRVYLSRWRLAIALSRKSIKRVWAL